MQEQAGFALNCTANDVEIAGVARDPTTGAPLLAEITITAVCKDDDGDGFLSLPNCTSWRNTDYVCADPTDAFPTTPSKCKCDDGFNVPVPVPPAELTVVKTATPTTLDEPGGAVTYAVSVTNIGIDPTNPVTLSSLVDDLYGDITQVQGAITATTCTLPQLIPSDDENVGGLDSSNCRFTANTVGNGGDTVTDTITARGVDVRGNPISGQDEASVSIEDVMPAIVVDKSASPGTVLEPGGNVTFAVIVSNTSIASSDPVTLTSLTDRIYGNLAGVCALPWSIPVGGSRTCTFTTFVAGNANGSETNVATASGGRRRRLAACAAERQRDRDAGLAQKAIHAVHQAGRRQP